MFLYGIGILYGRQFFEGMTGAAGRKYNLLALVARDRRASRRAGPWQAFGIKIGHTLGIYAGSMTSTATLQAALDVMRNKEPSIGYSVAYPFGVIGPILCIYFMTRHGAAEISAEGASIPYGRDHAGRAVAPAARSTRSSGPAERRAGDHGPQGAPERRPDAGRHLACRRRR